MESTDTQVSNYVHNAVAASIAETFKINQKIPLAEGDFWREIAKVAIIKFIICTQHEKDMKCLASPPTNPANLQSSSSLETPDQGRPAR